LRNVLFGETPTYNAQAHPFNRYGSASGYLIGGNLSILYSICGSDADVITEGKILFIEDLDEYLYHIDRMMMNLKRNGKLRGLAGLIVGGMTDMNDNTIPYGKTALEIIREMVEGYNYPVCFDFPAGHQKENVALIMGRAVNLKVDENGTTLEFLPAK
jgi:muramoyltetrapeptide carboxypeptidase